MSGSELMEAFVRLRVDSAQIKKDTERGLKSADGTSSGKKAGQQYGSGFSSSAASEIKKNAGKIAAAGTVAIVGVGVASIKMAGDFQAGMTRLVTSAGEAQKSIGLVSAGVLKLAVSTGTSTEQLSSGLYTIESAGYHGAAGLNVLKAAAQGARQENAQLGTVADAVTTVLTDYHLKASDAAKATSALIATVKSGKTNMELLSASLSRVLPTAAALHVSFPQIAGDIATLTAHGVSARLATQDLNSVLVALSAPSEKAAAAMKSVGLTSEQVSADVGKKGLTATLSELSDAFLKTAGPGGQLLLATLKGLPPAAKGAADAFLAGTISTKQLNKAIGDLTPAEQDQVKQFIKISGSATGLKENYVAAMTAMLGGTRGLGVALQLTGQNAVTAASDTKSIATAYRTAGKNVTDWEATQKTFNFRLSQFEQAANTTAITLGSKLLPAATATIGFFVGHRSVMGDFGAATLVAAGGVTALALAIKGVQVISTVYNAVTGGAAAVRAFSAAAVASAAIQKGLTAATIADATAQRTFAVAADGEVTSVVALNVAQKAAAISAAALAAVNPVVWAVAGAAAIAGLGVVLVKASNQTGDLIKQYQQQDKATGFNIAGYQKLAGQLGTVNDGQSKLSQTVRLSEGPVALAKNGSAAYSVALGEVTTAQTAAQRSSQAISSALGILQQNFGVTQMQAEGLAAKSGVTAVQLAATGTAGEKALGRVLSWATGAGAAAVAADQWADATGGASRALDTLGNNLLTTQGDQLGFLQAQQQATQAIKASTSGLDGNSAAALEARGALLQSSQAAKQLADQQLNVQHNVKGAAATLQGQIKYLQSTGDHSKFVTDEIHALETALAALKSKTVNVTVNGAGDYYVQAGVGHGLKPGSIPGQAAGGYMTGGIPGRDSILSMLMPGELVVPTAMVNAGAVDHLRGMLPGFAAGGIVPRYAGAPSGAEGAWMAGDVAATATIIEQATAKAAAAAIRTAQLAAAASSSGAGVAGPGGGAPAANAALARKLMPGWGSGAQWSAWNAVAMRESGWNQFARNPSSGAYGIPQALPPSKMGAAANPPSSNPTAQIRWMISYIQGRYGTPEGAWAHEQSAGWYAKGGLVRRVRGRAVRTDGLPGFAAGGVVGTAKPLSPAQKLKQQRLAELAVLVVKTAGLVKARNKVITTETQAVDAQELHNLLHPKDKAGVKKLQAMQRAITAYKKRTLGPILTDQHEINLLRVLTGNPAGAKYAGPVVAAPDTSSTDDSGTGDSSSSTAAAPPPMALPIPTFLAGAGGQGGFVAPGVSASSGLGGQPLGPAIGVTSIGGGAVPAMGAAVAGGGDLGAEFAKMRAENRQLMQQLTRVSAAAPIGAATRFADTMNGAARGARQRAAYSAVPGI